MARAYRRKRKGKFLGSFRLPLGAGTEVNLRTTDAIEAARRESAVRAAYARGVRGRDLEKAWSATAAATATVRAQDPARPKPAPRVKVPRPDPEMDVDDDDGDEDLPPGQGAGNPDGRISGDESVLPTGEAGSNPVSGSAPESEPLHEAAAAAAAETTGAEPSVVLDPKQKREAQARDEIQKCLAELGAEGEELGEQLFDGMAAAVLWFEGWAISKGINWRLKKQGRPLLEAAPGDEKALCRRLLRIGLKAEAIERWPWILDALTPKAAIVLGLALGAASAANSLQPAGTIAAQAPRSRPAPQAATSDAQPASA
jgi:hypothetical protein